MLTADIFCDVIDNFGDAGVCWRLARILSQEEGWKVRIYINDAQTLQALVPQLDPKNLPQIVDDVEVCRWESCVEYAPSDAVIETFGCRIPEEFEKRIAARVPQPIWVNLEYLSAEDWVEGCHGLPSPHPNLPVNKYFFFPGVTKKTGGLMIEKELEDRKAAFESRKTSFFDELKLNANVFTVFVFCYPQSPLKAFRQALLADGRPINVLFAAGKAADEWTALSESMPSEQIFTRVLPMVPQSDFDQFLWCADAVIIRGEDSFVRAQLAAKPMIWNIYPQTEKTHLVKLNAFGERIRPFCGDLYPLWHDINLAWNEKPETLVSLWAQWRNQNPALTNCAKKWRDELYSLGSLSKSLCKFIQLKLK